MATLSAIEIKPGTTPILTAIVDGEDLSGATVYVTIDMGDIKLIKSNYQGREEVALEPIYDVNEDVIGTTILAQYSQAETLRLRPGPASIEVGWIFEDGTAGKSDIGRLHIAKTLFKGVMEYGSYTS